MFQDLEVLAIIPARRHSKGIPNKNMAPLHGKPLLSWTIQAAKRSAYIDRVVVSTDDPYAAEYSLSCDCEVLSRPHDLARDESTASQVIAHALEVAQAQGYLVYLQPTSPLRLSQDIDASLEKLQAVEASAVVSVSKAREHPEWMFRSQANDGRLQPVLPLEDLKGRRQDLLPAYVLNGAIYAAKAQHLRPSGDFFQLPLVGYVMPYSRSIDIDDSEDLAEAARQLAARSA